MTFRECSKKDKIIKNRNTFNVKFKIAKTDDYINVPTINNLEELKQRIMILLRTEKNDLPRDKEFGSNISTIKHLDVTSKVTQEKLKEIVLDELVNILDDPKVNIVYKRINDVFYCQNLTIEIYDGFDLIYDFDLEA